MSSSLEFLYFTISTIDDDALNGLDVIDVAETIMNYPMMTLQRLKEFTDVLFIKALNSPNVQQYALLCALLLSDDWIFNQTLSSDSDFQALLISKCYDILLHNRKASKIKISNKHYLTICEFICELFNEGALPKEVMWSFVNDLAKQNNDQQVQALKKIFKLAGPTLANTYSLDYVNEKLAKYKDGELTQKSSLAEKYTTCYLSDKLNEGEQQAADVQNWQNIMPEVKLDNAGKNDQRQSTLSETTRRRILRWLDSQSDCRDPSPTLSTSWEDTTNAELKRPLPSSKSTQSKKRARLNRSSSRTQSC